MLLLLTLLLTFSSVWCGEETPIVNDDGMVVTTGEDVHAVTSYWKLVVTLDKPPPPTDVLENAKRLLTATQKLNLTEEFKTSWLSRIHNCVYRLKSLPEIRNAIRTRRRGHARVRRGLFDFIGHVSRALFGTATEEEVQETKKMVERVSLENEAVVHLVKELVTVVNKTRESAIANRDRLNELARRQNYMYAFLGRLSQSDYWTTVEIQRLKVKLEVDRILEDLELMTNAYCDAHLVYHFQRGALEWGRLSESILPLRHLEQILNEGKGQNMVSISPIEWYYRYCEVEPLWSTDKTLAYRVSIPFIESKQYIRYSVESFPIPLNDSELRTAQLDVQGSYGYDTITGDMFSLEKCVGKTPMVCDASVVYNNQGMKCARGIIGGDSNNRNTCPVVITKRPGQTLVTSVGLNNYVIVSWGEKVVKYCEGMPEYKFDMLMGVNHVSIKAQCTLTGTSWKLVGVRTHLRALNVSAWKLHAMKPFQLEQVVSVGFAKFQEQNSLSMLPEIHSVSLEKLKAGHLLPSRWTPRNEYAILPWINLVGIALIMSVLLVMARRGVGGTLQGCIVCKHFEGLKSPTSARTGVDGVRAQHTGELITPSVQFEEHSFPLSTVDRQGKTKEMKVIKEITCV